MSETMTGKARWSIGGRMGLWLLGGVIALALLAGHGPQQGATTLEVLVRDINGAPLEGVKVELYDGSQNIGVGNAPKSARTNPDGIASFTVSPGRYVIGFDASWGGRQFIPLEAQNAGANAKNGGGFPVTLDGSSPTHLVTFVITYNTSNMLVPLIDLSRDPAETPDPFLYEGVTGNEVTIDRELVDNLYIQAMATQISPKATEPTTTSITVKQADIGDVIVLVIALIVAGGAVVFMWTIIWMKSRREG